MEIRIIGAAGRVEQRRVEMFWRSVLLTQGLARADGCPVSAAPPRCKTFGAFGEKSCRIFCTQGKLGKWAVLLLRVFESVCDIRSKKHPKAPRRNFEKGLLSVQLIV